MSPDLLTQYVDDLITGVEQRMDREHRDADRDAPIPARCADALAASEWDYRVSQWLRKVTATDVLDELVEHEAELQRLMLAEDFEAIGRLVCNTRHAYAVSLALGEVL